MFSGCYATAFPCILLYRLCMSFRLSRAFPLSSLVVGQLRPSGRQARSSLSELSPPCRARAPSVFLPPLHHHTPIISPSSTLFLDEKLVRWCCRRSFSLLDTTRRAASSSPRGHTHSSASFALSHHCTHNNTILSAPHAASLLQNSTLTSAAAP